MDRARRAMPIGNKQCHARFVKKCQETHKKKLHEMKCSIDNQEPKRHPHLRKNLKKEQLMEERYAEIERDNRLLLEKMSYIMRHSSLDNDNQMQYAHSLNREQRKRELQRITRENQNILGRIQAAEPTYDHLVRGRVPSRFAPRPRGRRRRVARARARPGPTPPPPRRGPNTRSSTRTT